MNKIPLINLFLTLLKQSPMPLRLTLPPWLLFAIFYHQVSKNLLLFFQTYILISSHILPLLTMGTLTLLILTTYYTLLYKKRYKKPKYFKYCPECDFGINAKNTENYCQC